MNSENSPKNERKRTADEPQRTNKRRRITSEDVESVANCINGMPLDDWKVRVNIY